MTALAEDLYELRHTPKKHRFGHPLTGFCTSTMLLQIHRKTLLFTGFV